VIPTWLIVLLLAAVLGASAFFSLWRIAVWRLAGERRATTRAVGALEVARGQHRELDERVAHHQQRASVWRRKAVALQAETTRRREVATAARPVPTGTKADLMDSDLPGEIVRAIASAPVSDQERARLQRWAEIELLARGPDAAGAVAQEIMLGAEVDEDAAQTWM
jgi:hypothetical protein